MRLQFLNNDLPNLALGRSSFSGMRRSISLEGQSFLGTQLTSSRPAAPGDRKHPVFSLISWGISV